MAQTHADFLAEGGAFAVVVPFAAFDAGGAAGAQAALPRSCLRSRRCGGRIWSVPCRHAGGCDEAAFSAILQSKNITFRVKAPEEPPYTACIANAKTSRQPTSERAHTFAGSQTAILNLTSVAPWSPPGPPPGRNVFHWRCPPPKPTADCSRVESQRRHRRKSSTSRHLYQLLHQTSCQTG